MNLVKKEATKAKNKDADLKSHRIRLDEERAEIINDHSEEIQELREQLLKVQSEAELETEKRIAQVKADRAQKSLV